MNLTSIREQLEKRIPGLVLRYAAAVISLAILTGITVLCLHAFGPRVPVLSALLGFLFLVVILGSAWLGYGPGLIVACLVTFVLPQLLPVRRTGGVDWVRFTLFLAISVLVSRLGDTRRRREAELRSQAEELEERVRQRTEEAVRAARTARDSEENAREQAQLLDLAHDAVMAIEWDGKIHFWNTGAEQMYGWSRDEALGKISHDLLKTEFPEPLPQIRSKLATAGYWEGELVHTCRDGRRVWVSSRWALRRGLDGTPTGYLEINTDITERRRIQQQLQHTQKLESLGILAGGVAHDFNNLLTGILGNASLVLDGIPAHNPNHRLLEEVVKASERAADLTRQLLAYAGKGQFVMRTVNVSALVREISGLVQTSIPKQVQLRLQLEDFLPGIEGDPGQLQQILMNLIINGAEAIGPEGGSVLVRTATQHVDAQYISTMSSSKELLTPGEYVMLEVHDTGSGMDDATLARIFDPFFTTKFAGRGLGLSAVLGIVRAHHGALKVYSKLGQGTTFKVLFPSSAPHVSDEHPRMRQDLVGSGTVLIVDDEEVVRQTARHTLERYGYQTLAAENGAEAVELYRKHGDLAAVLLDLTMPVMNGEEALRRMQTINPNVRVLLSSGYNEVEAVQRFAGKGLAGFIQKPYTASALAEKMKEVVTRNVAAR